MIAKTLWIAILGLLLANTALAQPSVGIVDLVRVQNESERGRDNAAAIQKMMAERQPIDAANAGILAERRGQMATECGAEKTTTCEVAVEALAAAERLLLEEQNRHARIVNTTREDLDRELEGLVRRILPTIAEEMQLLLVVYASEQVAYWDTTIDITDEVIERLNVRYRGGSQ